MVIPEFTGGSINVGDNTAMAWFDSATAYPDINIIEQIDKETANIIDFI
ncbi:MAG: hypothetical protein PHZ03_08735 [Syntrophomonas sp.]|nr:hypothetical protein [Syntrophomonas sp.]